MRYFIIEITDTFSGQANYSWCRRYVVHAASQQAAMRRFNRKEGLQYMLYKYFVAGEVTRYNVRNACQCVFLQEIEADEAAKCGHVRLDAP